MGNGGGRDILIIILLIAGVWLVWLFSGGPERIKQNRSENGPSKGSGLITPTQTTSAPLGTISSKSNSSNLVEKTTEVTDRTLGVSYYQNWIQLGSGSAKREFYPAKEYITLSVTQRNVSYLFISDWKLKNSLGETVRIGDASYTPFVGQVNTTHPVVLAAGDKLTISTGQSPIGVSFRVNKCSGYLEQFQDFVPPLQVSCPSPSSEEDAHNLPRECQSYIRSLPRCTANVDILPDDLTAECRDYINTQINYNSCVLLHRDDKDFYKNEWRIYLGEPRELWLERDTITLLDDEGKEVDTIKY